MSKITETQQAQNQIHRIRGHQVMLDSDLATLYHVATKNLNKAVKRNIIRFPQDFMFRLTQKEFDSLRFQSGTLKRGAHTKYLPCVFTQEGIAMLSSVLRSTRAALANIAIMRAFVRQRRSTLRNHDLGTRVEKLEGRADLHETDIRLLVQDIQQLKRRTDLPDHPINPTLI